MTNNQIQYWSLQEQKRSNRANEVETNRHNMSTEAETNRHNVATEGLDLSKLSETTRHNKASEGIDAGRLSESIRHDKASEQLSGVDLNIKKENLSESIRHNFASEAANQIAAEARMRAAEASLNNASVNMLKAENDALSLGYKNDLLKAQTELARVEKDWKSLLGNSTLGVNDAKIAETASKIAELEAQTQYSGQRNIREWISTISDTLTDVSNLIDSIIPF